MNSEPRTLNSELIAHCSQQKKDAINHVPITFNFQFSIFNFQLETRPKDYPLVLELLSQ